MLSSCTSQFVPPKASGQGCLLLTPISQSFVLSEWGCVVTSWTSLQEVGPEGQGQALWGREHRRVVCISSQYLQLLTDEGTSSAHGNGVEYSQYLLQWHWRWFLCKLQLVPEIHREANVCAKAQKNWRDPFSLEEPATKYGWVGRVGGVIGGEAERMLVDNVGLRMKQLWVWILTVAYWPCDLEWDTWLFLASVSSFVKWVWKEYFSGLLWECNEIVEVNHGSCWTWGLLTLKK